jgi:hypothetical protein
MYQQNSRALTRLLIMHTKSIDRYIRHRTINIIAQATRLLLIAYRVRLVQPLSWLNLERKSSVYYAAHISHRRYQ